jgi:hypothetical protein
VKGSFFYILNYNDIETGPRSQSARPQARGEARGTLFLTPHLGPEASRPETSDLSLRFSAYAEAN